MSIVEDYLDTFKRAEKQIIKKGQVDTKYKADMQRIADENQHIAKEQGDIEKELMKMAGKDSRAFTTKDKVLIVSPGKGIKIMPTAEIM